MKVPPLRTRTTAGTTTRSNFDRDMHRKAAASSALRYGEHSSTATARRLSARVNLRSQLQRVTVGRRRYYYRRESWLRSWTTWGGYGAVGYVEPVTYLAGALVALRRCARDGRAEHHVADLHIARRRSARSLGQPARRCSDRIVWACLVDPVQGRSCPSRASPALFDHRVRGASQALSDLFYFGANVSGAIERAFLPKAKPNRFQSSPSLGLSI